MKPTSNEERRKAKPETRDLESAKEVWNDGEVAPAATKPAPRTGELGRVADAGDIGAGSPSPYGTEVQAEIVGTYTRVNEQAPKKEGDR